MNKAITDGIEFMPRAFEHGLDRWSSGDGTPGSETYDGAFNAAFVPADADFGGCLELQKSDTVQKLRYMGQTPMQPGCYLMIRARIKAVSGNLPQVRIAGWAGDADGHIADVPEFAAPVQLTGYGAVVEVTGIVGSGPRGGVDMPWGPDALYGHFGLDLIGPNGGIVRIDDIEITDISAAFLDDKIGLVDVRDYGAVGDGVSDDSFAFEAADKAADGRRVLVPEGVFHLAETTSLKSQAVFVGRVTMPADKMLLMTKSFDLPTYIDAFKDEDLAFRKAFQALVNNSDHESLDMGGRKISVSAPIDMAAAVPNRPSYATRRVIRNGQFDAQESTEWDTEVFTSQATYAPSQNARVLKNVVNVVNIPVGALVSGNGVGREIYVRSKDVAAQEITLNAPLFDADGTQVFTFTAFKYLLDFSGFSKLAKFGIQNVEFQCNGRCSGIRLAPNGAVFSLSDSFVSRPRDRGITSIGGGCQGMLIDQCQFLSTEETLNVADRRTIALNVNANDVKLRNNRSTNFLHFAVLGGGNHIVLGNHFFQGDAVSDGVRSAGLILQDNYVSVSIVGNYVDNCFVEWTNERDPDPDFSGGFSFSSLSISDNVFLASDVAPWFAFVIVKPHGNGHFLNGVSVTGNKFKAVNGVVDRIEAVDTSFADLDYDRFKHVEVSGNTYHQITRQAMSPLRVRHSQPTAAQTWVVDPAAELPFGGWARAVDGVVPINGAQAAQGPVFAAPYVSLAQGAARDQVHLVWPKPVRGVADVILRVDT
ncbi:Pectate lyase superfamily protein [Cribrihabitans marinus]|uniref:Pectate lyase superfamily protein n=1 Tax=Cribrihabitans marinus TaxID=1227549 RepID=A0A1H7CM45_9RHOB|nr:glycosyl hydrolase family 28-related protein [Cribrihabitans marinus]GGH36023.1 hypothetical protein GCM10010973_29730 [Cribrihabitans marinus]SEJ90748.1 Pectate lyase superfamily protein [Cribrihabitans marinus]